MDPLPTELTGIADLIRPLSLDTLSAAGVYFLIDGSEVVYVGKSVRAASRISHHLDRMKFDRVLLMPCPPEKMIGVERRWINLLKPKHNKRVDTPLPWEAFRP